MPMPASTPQAAARANPIRINSPSDPDAHDESSNRGGSPSALRVLRLDRRAAVPAYHSAHAAGLDLSACLPEPVTIEPGGIALIRTGLALAIPPGFEGQVRPRSGLASRHGLSMPNAPGTIDADYRGEVIVPLINHGREAFTVTPGMRIAQLVIAPVARVTIEEVDALDATPRGAGGFGSTGLR